MAFLSNANALPGGYLPGDDLDETDEAYLGEQQGRLRNVRMPVTQNYGRAPWPIRSYESVANKRNILEDESLVMSDAQKEDMRWNIDDTAMFDDPLFHGERTTFWPSRVRRRVPHINNPNKSNAPTSIVISDFTLEQNIEPPLRDAPIVYGAYPYRAKSKFINVYSQQVVQADYEQA